MKTKVERGYYHNVRSDNGCTVTQIKPNGQTLVDEIPAGETTAVFAFSSEFEVSDDTAVVQQVFKLAPYQKLRLLGVVGGNDGGLPAGYTRVEYLESTGTQYINLNALTVTDTDVISWRADRVKIVGQPDGVFSDMDARVRFIYNNQWNYNVADFFKPSVTQNGNSAPLVNIGTWELSRGKLKQNGEEFPLADGTGSVTGMFVFTQYVKRFYPCAIKLYKWGVEGKCHLLPALDPTGTPCMFDTVTKTPFRNSGTGAFIAGIETQKQLDAMLRKLPDLTGLEVGTLQVRLADDLQTPENEAKLDAMLAKNWEITQAA
jgi:hypothetical protein